MKFRHLALLLIPLFFYNVAYGYISLQNVYDNAQPQGDFDKFIELDPTQEYLGDLDILDEIRVFLDGNGAIIHSGDSFAVFVSDGDVVLQNCVILGGAKPIFYGSYSSGVIRSNTIVGSTYAGISVCFPNLDKGVDVYNNIIIDGRIGYYCVEDFHADYLGYNTVYNMTEFRYAEYCPD